MRMYVYITQFIHYMTLHKKSLQFSLVRESVRMYYGLNNQGLKLARAGDYLSPKISRWPLQPTQLHIQWVEWALSPELKWPGYEGDHAPPSIAEVKNEWNCMSPLPVYLYGMYMDNFTFKGKSDLCL